VSGAVPLIAKTLFSILGLFWPVLALAASGPLAEGFGREAWLEKIHVVIIVVAVVVVASGLLIVAILCYEPRGRDAADD
jgi:hypothetical protein